MSRAEYMSRLAQLLADIPEDEREDALNYYNDYFDAGGEENEEQNILALGTPEELAKTIRLASNDTNVIDGEFTETGYSSGINDTKDVPDKYTQIVEGDKGVGDERTYKVFGRTYTRSALLLIIVLLVLAAPIIVPVVLGVLGGVFGVIFGILGAVIGLVVGLFGSGISVIVGSVFGIVVALLSLLSKPLGALTILGFSLLGLSVGGLMFAGCGALAGAIPSVCRWTVSASKAFISFMKGLLFGKEENEDEKID